MGRAAIKRAQRDGRRGFGLSRGRGGAQRPALRDRRGGPEVLRDALGARGYVDACAADAHDAAQSRGDAAPVVAVAAAGGAAVVAPTLSCLLAELSGVGRTRGCGARAGGGAAPVWRRRRGRVRCLGGVFPRRVDGVEGLSRRCREQERDPASMARSSPGKASPRGKKHTGAVAFGLVSQAAQHAKATRTIPSEATNAALLCESALSWDAGDAPAHARQSYPAVWRGRLDACLDDCASLREVCARDDACARPVVASVRLLAAAAGPAITSDEPGYRAAAARSRGSIVARLYYTSGPARR